jgi:hypothetical protein
VVLHLCRLLRPTKMRSASSNGLVPIRRLGLRLRWLQALSHGLCGIASTGSSRHGGEEAITQILVSVVGAFASNPLVRRSQNVMPKVRSSERPGSRTVSIVRPPNRKCIDTIQGRQSSTPSAIYHCRGIRLDELGGFVPLISLGDIRSVNSPVQQDLPQLGLRPSIESVVPLVPARHTRVRFPDSFASPTLNTLLRMAHALELDLWKLLKRAMDTRKAPRH